MPALAAMIVPPMTTKAGVAITSWARNSSPVAPGS